MKTNQEILDSFGLYIIKINDRQFKYTKFPIEDLCKDKNYKELFMSMTSKQKEQLELLMASTIQGTIFDFLKFFEEQVIEETGRFKLIYEEDGKQVDLVEISEMLKAEMMGDTGWIKRFSKYPDSGVF